MLMLIIMKNMMTMMKIKRKIMMTMMIMMIMIMILIIMIIIFIFDLAFLLLSGITLRRLLLAERLKGITLSNVCPSIRPSFCPSICPVVTLFGSHTDSYY